MIKYSQRLDDEIRFLLTSSDTDIHIKKIENLLHDLEKEIKEKENNDLD